MAFAIFSATVVFRLLWSKLRSSLWILALPQVRQTQPILIQSALGCTPFVLIHFSAIAGRIPPHFLESSWIVRPRLPASALSRVLPDVTIIFLFLAFQPLQLSKQVL